MSEDMPDFSDDFLRGFNDLIIEIEKDKAVQRKMFEQFFDGTDWPPDVIEKRK